MNFKQRPAGWYELREHSGEYLEVSRLDEFTGFGDLTECIAHWSGEIWDEVAHAEKETVPTHSTLAEISEDRGATYLLFAEILKVSSSDDALQARLLDYLANFPTRYESIDKEPQFDSQSIEAWSRYAIGKIKMRPDYKFASFYISEDGYWGEPRGLEYRDANFLHSRPYNKGEGCGSYVIAVLGLELNSWYKNRCEYFGEPLDSEGFEEYLNYRVFGWEKNLMSDSIFPRYDNFTAAESFVLSRLIGLVLDLYPLPMANLSTAGHAALQKALKIIHSPGKGEVQSARDASIRDTVLSTLERNFGAPRNLELTINGAPRLEIMGHQVGGIERLSTSPTLPSPRLVKTFQEAEEYAASVMAALGFSKVQVSRMGSDEGIDVSSFEALAQVKMEGVKTSREKIQRLTGVCSVYKKDAIFFSLSGYSVPALEWAEKTSTACFEFDYDGSLMARSTEASNLLKYGA